MVKDLGKTNSIFNQFLMELRDVGIQKDPMRFRKNLHRMGEIFAYEISKTLEYKLQEVTTPLGMHEMHVLAEQPILGTILRAGLPMHEGLLSFFDRAESSFISAYRKYSKEEQFTIKLDYLSTPEINKKVLILSDPMLATGGSLLASINGLLENGKPKHIHVVSAIASEEGIANVKKMFSLKNLTIWVGAIDAELTAQAYIVPGLGDAGDLAFGKKGE